MAMIAWRFVTPSATSQVSSCSAVAAGAGSPGFRASTQPPI
jgi:hypothetical protein